MGLGGPGQKGREAATCTDQVPEDFGEHDDRSSLQPVALQSAPSSHGRPAGSGK